MEDVIPSLKNLSWIHTHVAKVSCSTRFDGPCRDHSQLYFRFMLKGGGAASVSTLSIGAFRGTFRISGLELCLWFFSFTACFLSENTPQENRGEGLEKGRQLESGIFMNLQYFTCLVRRPA